MSNAKKITFHSFLVGEDLRQEVTGLQSIIGLFPRRIESPLPTLQLPKIVFRIDFDSTENFKGECKVTLKSPSGAQVFATPSPVPMEIKKATPNIFALGWGPAIFSEPGIYELTVSIDDKYKFINHFMVVLAGKSSSNQKVG